MSKMITIPKEEYERLREVCSSVVDMRKEYSALVALLEVRIAEQQEATKEAREHNGYLRDWLYAYKRNYEALTEKYCLPCTVGWNFSKN